MKLLLLALILTSCGADVANQMTKDDESPEVIVKNCSTERTDEGVKISCPDGSESIIADGSNGSDGSNGTDGEDGSEGEAGSAGNNGTNGTDGSKGNQGTAGMNGNNGTNGTDGTDATLRKVYDETGLYWGEHFLTNSHIKLPSGAVIQVLTSSPYNLMSKGDLYYTSSDCSGTPHWAPNALDIDNASYSILRSKWYMASGTVTKLVTFNSKELSNNTCNTSTVTRAISQTMIEIDMTDYNSRFTFSGTVINAINGPFYIGD